MKKRFQIFCSCVFVSVLLFGCGNTPSNSSKGSEGSNTSATTSEDKKTEQPYQEEDIQEKVVPLEDKVQISFPVHGTIFVDSNIILTSDPTTFKSLTEAGIGSREMYDRRVDNWITVDAFLFEVTYDDGLQSEVRVNPEFETVEAAKKEALKYARRIGQLPTALRRDVKSITINKGKELYGGGNEDILIHTGQTSEYERDGILEETLVHEATHTSLDAYHAYSEKWIDAQLADGKFISSYAADYPTREDLAETFLMYLAVRYRADRIATGLKDSIVAQIPERIKYLDSLKLEMYPIIQE
ncbi:MAG: hypothetical protein AAF573_17535 [Bacteroidota bacterium]